MLNNYQEYIRMQKILDPNISIEMIYSFMEDFTPRQLEKLSEYASKLYGDKRYKNKKTNGKNTSSC